MAANCKTKALTNHQVESVQLQLCEMLVHDSNHDSIIAILICLFWVLKHLIYITQSRFYPTRLHKTTYNLGIMNVSYNANYSTLGFEWFLVTLNLPGSHQVALSNWLTVAHVDDTVAAPADGSGEDHLTWTPSHRCSSDFRLNVVPERACARHYVISLCITWHSLITFLSLHFQFSSLAACGLFGDWAGNSFYSSE